MYDFLKDLVKAIQEAMGAEYQVSSTEVLKNNSKKLSAVLIKGKDEKAVPTIYINRFYEEYHKGVSDIQEISKKIINIYNENKGSLDITLDEIFDYKKVVNRISFKLINAKRNEERLKDIVYVMHSNLALVFQIELLVDSDSVGSTLVSKELLKHWNTSVDQLYSDVLSNLSNIEPPVMKNMYDIMNEIVLGDTVNLSDEEIENTGDRSPNQMYVLTNKRKLNGSAVILYPEIEKVVKKVAHASNFYVLPSSVHELILIPFSEEMDKNELREMIRQVNAEEVAQEDFLSDDLYFYNVDSREFVVVEK